MLLTHEFENSQVKIINPSHVNINTSLRNKMTFFKTERCIEKSGIIISFTNPLTKVGSSTNAFSLW